MRIGGEGRKRDLAELAQLVAALACELSGLFPVKGVEPALSNLAPDLALPQNAASLGTVGLRSAAGLAKFAGLAAQETLAYPHLALRHRLAVQVEIVEPHIVGGDPDRGIGSGILRLAERFERGRALPPGEHARFLASFGNEDRLGEAQRRARLGAVLSACRRSRYGCKRRRKNWEFHWDVSTHSLFAKRLRSSDRNRLEKLGARRSFQPVDRG